MKVQKILKLLETEKECVSRDCDRDCIKCDLVQKKDELIEMYNNVINIIGKEAVRPFELNKNHLYCGSCGCRIHLKQKPKYCAKCGAPILFPRRQESTQEESTSEYSDEDLSIPDVDLLINRVDFEQGGLKT